MAATLMIDSEKLYSHIGHNLKSARQSKKLKQTDIADILGLTRTSIINYEKGTQKISLSLLYLYCELLEIHVEDVLPNQQDVSVKDNDAQSNSEDTAEETIKNSTARLRDY